MNPYIILADATCDLNESFQKQYDIVIVPGHVILPDKSEISAPLTWDRFTREEFYNDLKKHPNDYKTAPPNAEEFRCVFTKYVEAGYDILAMSISGGISGAPNFMRAAKEAVLAEHPLAQIQIVDSLRFGPGFGLMVIWASRMRASGKSLEENVAWLEENRSRFHQAGFQNHCSFEVDGNAAAVDCVHNCIHQFFFCRQIHMITFLAVIVVDRFICQLCKRLLILRDREQARKAAAILVIVPAECFRDSLHVQNGFIG